MGDRDRTTTHINLPTYPTEPVHLFKLRQPPTEPPLSSSLPIVSLPASGSLPHPSSSSCTPRARRCCKPPPSPGPAGGQIWRPIDPRDPHSDIVCPSPLPSAPSPIHSTFQRSRARPGGRAHPDISTQSTPPRGSLPSVHPPQPSSTARGSSLARISFTRA